MAAAFYGQVRLDAHSNSRSMYESDRCSFQAKLSQSEIEALARVLGISAVSIESELGSHWWPNRGLGPVPPTDPVIYRLYEVRAVLPSRIALCLISL